MKAGQMKAGELKTRDINAGSSNPAGGRKPASGDGAVDLFANRGWRWAGLAVLALVLAVAFAGYLSPSLMLQWENLLALCGF